MTAAETAPTGPFRGDARFERTTKVAHPSVLKFLGTPGAPFLVYWLFVGLFTTALSWVTDSWYGMLTIHMVWPLLLRRAPSGPTDEAYGECGMGPEGIHCELLDQTTEHAFETVQRVRVSGRYVVLRLLGDEPLVLEPSGDPHELARWIEDRAPSQPKDRGAVLFGLGILFVVIQLCLVLL